MSSRPRSPIAASLAALAFVVTVPGSGAAQVVTGQVLEIPSTVPVSAVDVELLAGERGDQVVARHTTDEEGRFSITAAHPGTYRLRARRIGYQTTTTPAFDLFAVEAPFELEVFVGVDAIPLAPLAVVSERPLRAIGDLRLELAGYNERRATWSKQEGMGFGAFLGPAELEERHAFFSSDYLRDLDGVRVESAGGRARVVTMRNATNISDGGRCIPLVFVDGARLGTAWDLDELVSASSILAMEVYPGRTQPAQYDRGQLCGSIVIWTGR